MIRIAICDDDIKVCTKIGECIEEISEDQTQRVTYDVYHDGAALINALKEDAFYDFIFMDIQMEDMSGIEAGNLIRDHFDHNKTDIIYISTLKEYAMDLFHSRPMDFLVKPLTREMIINALHKAIKLLQLDDVIFEYKIGTATHRISISDIYFFESRGRKVVMHTISGEIEYYDKLKNIHSKLQMYDFLMIHKSYLANFKKVSKLSYDHIVLKNGVELGISQNYRSSVRLNQLQRGGK